MTVLAILSDLVLEPLGFEFFRNALLASVIVGLLCGLMGVFVVLRGMSYIGHGLSHAAFGGAVAGYLLKLNFYVSATLGALLAAVVIQRISDGQRVKGDAAIGVVTNALFAIGVALLSSRHRFERSFEAALFGNILGVQALDLWVMAAALAVCGLAVGWFYRDLFFATFDSETAEIAGVPAGRLWTVFSLLLALCIIASMNVVGVTMIASALVMPAATARMLTESFHRMMVAAPLLGAATGVGGLFASYHLNVASGASIVMFGSLLFGAAWLWHGWRDTRARRRTHLHRHGPIVHAHPHLGSHGGAAGTPRVKRVK